MMTPWCAFAIGFAARHDLRQVQQFPESGRQVPEAGNAEVRELIESPYRIIYRVRQEAIEILAIVHGRQAVSYTHLTLPTKRIV